MSYIFLAVFKNICIEKGHEFIYIPKKKKKKKGEDKEADENAETEMKQCSCILEIKDQLTNNDSSSNNDILEPSSTNETITAKGLKTINTSIINAKDISDEKYQDLLKKQKQSIATQRDKLEIKKHYYKRSLGLDKLDDDLLTKFKYCNKINNFLYLIDETNKNHCIKIKEDELRTKRQYILNIINKLGFSLTDIYNDKNIKFDIFETNMNNVIEYLLNEYINNKRFNIILNESKHNIRKMKDKSLKAHLGYINSFLASYSLKIAVAQEREMHLVNKINYYSLQLLDNIDELIEYKIKYRGFKMSNSDNIFKYPKDQDNYEYIYSEYIIEDLHNKTNDTNSDTNNEIDDNDDDNIINDEEYNIIESMNMLDNGINADVFL